MGGGKGEGQGRAGTTRRQRGTKGKKRRSAGIDTRGSANSTKTAGRPKDPKTTVDFKDWYVTGANVLEVFSVRRGNKDPTLERDWNTAKREVGRGELQVNFCGNDVEVGRAVAQVNFNEPTGIYEMFGKAEVD